jgi:hypothetical protein
MSVPDFWRNEQFLAWLRGSQNSYGLEMLCEYIGAKRDEAVQDAIKKGDTEFDKGRAEALKDLRNDITNMQSDTGTGTGEPRHGNGDGQRTT